MEIHNVEKFFETIGQFIKLSQKSRDELSSALKRLELPKGHILIKAGSVCNHIYFIEEGLTRTFYYKDGKDVTDWISPEGTFAVSLVSFITRKPDRRTVELLEPSVIWSLQYYALENLYKKSPELERMGRLLVNRGLILLQKRFDELHFATALERYKILLEENPTIVQRVPLGMIASYLGITQETLSRIRGQV